MNECANILQLRITEVKKNTSQRKNFTDRNSQEMKKTRLEQ